MISPLLISANRFADDRGWFSESYNARKFAAFGLDATFVQDNQSFSRVKGTIRGLHFQAPPFAQGKLVQVLQGRILDFAVDIRVGSPTYGQWVSAELSAEQGQQFYVPTGYAHGFVTQEPNTIVFYKVTSFYDKASEGGLAWNDPSLAIDWKLDTSQPTLSQKDAILPTFLGFKSPFVYNGIPMQLLQR